MNTNQHRQGGSDAGLNPGCSLLSLTFIKCPRSDASSSLRAHVYTFAFAPHHVCSMVSIGWTKLWECSLSGAETLLYWGSYRPLFPGDCLKSLDGTVFFFSIPTSHRRPNGFQLICRRHTCVFRKWLITFYISSKATCLFSN